MLWLAGLMGLMTVSAVVYIDVIPEEEIDDLGGTGRDAPPPTDDILSGTKADDLLSGGAGDDQIGGYAGEDRIHGGTGDDDLHGAEGNDTLSGDAGRDSLHGEDGDDDLYGSDGEDSLMGHNDDDYLFGGEDDDFLLGSAGDDRLGGGAGDDVLQGGLDDDALFGGAGSDSLFGGWGDDTLSGGETLASLPGLAENEALDYLNGGGGDDLIIAGAQDIVTSGEGTDRIVLGDWIRSGTATEILDYAPEDDSLMFVWDDSAGAAAPALDILPNPEDPTQLQISSEGTLIARVTGTTTLTQLDIALIPLSSATGLTLLDTGTGTPS